MRNPITEKDIEAYRKKARVALAIGIPLIALAPILFLLLTALPTPPCFKWIGLSDTGSIGDTLGGITAPMVGVLAAILVYYSFEQQLRANKMQSDALVTELGLANSRHVFERANLLLKSITATIEKIWMENEYMVLNQFSSKMIANEHVSTQEIEQVENILKPLIHDMHLFQWLCINHPLEESDLAVLYQLWFLQYKEINELLRQVYSVTIITPRSAELSATLDGIDKVIKGQLLFQEVVLEIDMELKAFKKNVA